MLPCRALLLRCVSPHGWVPPWPTLAAATPRRWVSSLHTSRARCDAANHGAPPPRAKPPARRARGPATDAQHVCRLRRARHLVGGQDGMTAPNLVTKVLSYARLCTPNPCHRISRLPDLWEKAEREGVAVHRIRACCPRRLQSPRFPQVRLFFLVSSSLEVVVGAWGTWERGAGERGAEVWSGGAEPLDRGWVRERWCLQQFEPLDRGWERESGCLLVQLVGCT
jgi:hypothetical protein